MKTSKGLMKIAVSAVMSIFLLSTVASAATIKVPNMGNVAREYADMVGKARIFGNIQNLVTYSFTEICINEATLNSAIRNANMAADNIRNLRFYDGENRAYTDRLYYHWASNSGIVPYVRDNGYITRVNQLLRLASVGPVDLSLKTEVSDEVRRIRPTGEYFDKLYVLTSHDLFTTGNRMSIVDFQTTSASDIKTLNQVNSYFDDYASFLTSLKNFYKAAGCYSPTTPVTPPRPTTPTRPIRPVRPAIPKRDPVITVTDKTIKVGTKFVLMSGVKAMDNGGRGPNITNKVTISGTINTSRVGTYRITYKVRGANGNLVTKIARYKVVR